MKKIPWWEPKVEKEDYRFIARALEENFVNEGPLVVRFERAITRLTRSGNAVATTSCTAAMFLALKALGIGQGDEVIVPDITFIATANAVTLSGATPILVDVEPKRLTIDVGALERAITKKTRAIIPVHVSGRAADMASILRLARKYKLFVIEDAAEALGSRKNNRHLGTFGDIGCFSFAANKTVATGQGGMAITNNARLAQRMRELRNQGRKARGTGGDDIHDTIGFNFRMTDLQAGAGLGQLAHFAERMKRMRRNFELYRRELAGIKELRVYPTDSESGELPQWTDIETERRDELETYLRRKGIDCRKYWLPIHRQKAHARPNKDFSNATRLSPRSLWLPSAFTLTDKEVLTVCCELRNFFALP